MTTFPNMHSAQARQAREYAALSERDRNHVRYARDDMHAAADAGHPQADLLSSLIYLDASEKLHRALILAAGDACSEWLDGERERAFGAACDARQEAAE